MLVSLISAAGSPGATTLAAAMCAGRRALFVEASPFGGVVAARALLQREAPGLLALVSVASRPIDGAQIVDHSRGVGPGIATLMAPSDGAQATAALAMRASELASALRHVPNVVCDAGRWWTQSPSTPLVAAADAVIVCVRSDAGDALLTRSIAERVATACGHNNIGCVVIGRGSWRAQEVAEAVGLPLIDEIPTDHRTAPRIFQYLEESLAKLERTPLMLSARRVCDTVGIAADTEAA